MNPRVSIIIPTYKRREMLADLLLSIKKNIPNLTNVEIIVIDDASPQHSEKEEFIRSAVKDLPFVYLQENTNAGQAHTRNVAVKSSHGEIIAFLDDDTEITERWLDEIIRDYDDEKIAGIGGYTKEFQTKTITEKFLSHVQYLHRHQFNPDGTMAFICTANSSFRRSAFLSVGGFNEELRWSAEDQDLGFKLAKMGYRFSYNSNAVVSHKHKSTYFQMMRLFFISGRGAYRCANLHKDYQKKNVTRLTLFEPLIVLKTVKNVMASTIREMGPGRKYSRFTYFMFMFFEVGNHVFYQLGRYYEFLVMKLRKPAKLIFVFL